MTDGDPEATASDSKESERESSVPGIGADTTDGATQSSEESEQTDDEETEKEQFEELEAGAGCTEIWEHLSKRRGD